MRCWVLIVAMTLGLAALASPVAAQGLIGYWQVCDGALSASGPSLKDCRPLAGKIDPQGRELWITAPVRARTAAEAGPSALYISGTASTQAWFNGAALGSNGSPGRTAAEEEPGRYDARLAIDERLWQAEGNRLVLRLSSFHAGPRLDYPVSGVWIGPFPGRPRTPLMAISFAAAGALTAASFGFGSVYAMRRTPSSLYLAAMAGVPALQALVENLRTLTHYAYPWHIWRVAAIWVLSAVFAWLLASFATIRFVPRGARWVQALAALAIPASFLLKGYDWKTAIALFIGVSIAAAAAAVGVARRQPGAGPSLAYLAAFLGVALAAPNWFLDLTYVLLVAGLTLPLLVLEVLRLGRADLAREQALTLAVSRPHRLAVTSARGVELVPVAEIVAIVGADDYAELRLNGGRSLLHAVRLEQLVAQLPACFMRVHRSAIANLARAESLERDTGRWRLHLSDGVVLPVSRSRLTALREALDDDGAAASLAAAQ
jgi:DNA-binding LytR/AlgR family response regulator